MHKKQKSISMPHRGENKILETKKTMRFSLYDGEFEWKKFLVKF